MFQARLRVEINEFLFAGSESTQLTFQAGEPTEAGRVSVTGIELVLGQFVIDPIDLSEVRVGVSGLGADPAMIAFPAT